MTHDTFHVLDLSTQALAVQRLLTGRTADEKLAWLAAHGGLSRVPMNVPNSRPIYRFVSSVGLECSFFIDGDQFVFIGDHTTYTAKEEDPA
jgi:hypothetical protein